MSQAKAEEQTNRLKVRRPITVGSISVEMALVTPLLLVLLFGIIEFGLIFKDVAVLKQAAREGVRDAALGETTTEITARVESNAATLNIENLDIEMKYRVYAGSWPMWDSAPTLDNIGSGEGAQNNAPQGAQIRVQITYPHHLISGSLFSELADDPEGETMTLTACSTMRRE